jgi:hypothetical protein
MPPISDFTDTDGTVDYDRYYLAVDTYYAQLIDRRHVA